MKGDPAARNIAEVILDLFHENAPPRCDDTMRLLIQHQIEWAQWLAKKPLLEEIKRLKGQDG